jgi:regulation of enolase protein 1 (concanavalin A-like superfamily)
MKMNIMAKTLAAAVLSFGSVAASTAQTLEKMTWYNEPAKWAVSDGALLMEVTPKSDYWRISHYGFTVDDAPFYYATYGGEFEAKVKITGDYQARFDQAGLMVRIDHENYIKAGIEYVGGKYNLSVVVTHTTSDWSVITLDKPVESVWIKAVRRRDAVEVFYSFDDKEYVMMRNAWLKDNTPVMVGMMGACPDGDGFNVRFDNFSVKHLPDVRRTEWLERNKE